MKQISDAAQSLATELQTFIAVDADGKAVVADGAFEKAVQVINGEDGTLTVEQVQQSLAAVGKYAVAATLATGIAAEPVVRDNAGVDRVQAQWSITEKDAVKVTYDRSAMRRTGVDANAEMVEVHGVTRTAVVHHSIGARGDMKAVHQMLQEQAAAAYGKK